MPFHNIPRLRITSIPNSAALEMFNEYAIQLVSWQAVLRWSKLKKNPSLRYEIIVVTLPFHNVNLSFHGLFAIRQYVWPTLLILTEALNGLYKSLFWMINRGYLGCHDQNDGTWSVTTLNQIILSSVSWIFTRFQV